MENINVSILTKEKILTITKFTILFGAAIVLPLFHNQLITGPLINAVLFLSVIYLGREKALVVGLIPSVIALSAGLLPAVLAPMVPFIMISNVIMILTFGYFQKKKYWLGVVAASLLKFIFLTSVSSLVINLLLQKTVADKVSLMMSYPQLLTAIVGGIFAYGVLKLVKRMS